MNDWNPDAVNTKLDRVRIQGIEVKEGDLVRLRPRRSADILDLALKGKLATVEAIEQDMEGQVHLAVVIEDDPGRDLGMLAAARPSLLFRPRGG